MRDTSAATIAYVRFVLQHRRLTPSGLAKLAGISSSTLTRLLNKPDHKFKLSISTLQKLEDASGYSYSSFVKADGISGVSIPIKPLNFSDNTDIAEALDGMMPVIIGLGAGIWYDRDAPSFGEQVSHLPLSFTRIAIEKSIAFQVRGSSCDRLALNEEYLLCEKIDGSLERWAETYVVVETYRDGGKFIELSAQHAAKRGDRIVYTFPSSDPVFAGRTTEATVGDFALIRPIAHVRFVVRRPRPPKSAGSTNADGLV